MCYTEQLRPHRQYHAQRRNSLEDLVLLERRAQVTCLECFLPFFLKSNLIGLIPPFCLPSVLHCTVFLHSRTPISSCSYTVGCLLAQSSGNLNPKAVPSQYIKYLCAHVRSVKNCSFLTNTQIQHVRY
jgi:hypothetical protein